MTKSCESLFGLCIHHYAYQTVVLPEPETPTSLMDEIQRSSKTMLNLLNANIKAFDLSQVQEFVDLVMKLNQNVQEISVITESKYKKKYALDQGKQYREIVDFNYEFRGVWLMILHFLNECRAMAKDRNTKKFRIMLGKVRVLAVATKFGLILAKEKKDYLGNSPYSDNIRLQDFEEFKTANILPFLEDIGTHVWLT
jgi:hypothetical protein